MSNGRNLLSCLQATFEILFINNTASDGKDPKVAHANLEKKERCYTKRKLY